jgi:hypothetical protein
MEAPSTETIPGGMNARKIEENASATISASFHGAIARLGSDPGFIDPNVGSALLVAVRTILCRRLASFLGIRILVQGDSRRH